MKIWAISKENGYEREIGLELDGVEAGFEWSPAYSVAPRTRAPVVRDRLT